MFHTVSRNSQQNTQVPPSPNRVPTLRPQNLQRSPHQTDDVQRAGLAVSIENIQVFLRMRPLNQNEQKEEILAPETDFRTCFKWLVEPKSITLMQTESVLNMSQSHIQTPTRQSKQMQNAGRQYKFDHCYDENVLNADIYRKSCQQIVTSSLQGINGTIFMYGQTGAGKTHTMLGDYSVDILQNIGGTTPQRPKTPSRYSRKEVQELAHLERTPTSIKSKLSKSVLSGYHNSSIYQNNRGTPIRKTRKKTTHVLPRQSQDDCRSVPRQSQGEDDCRSENFGQLDITSEDACDVLSQTHHQQQTIEYADIQLKELECTFRNRTQKSTSIPSDKGILIHSLSDLFRSIDTIHKTSQKVQLRCSYFEIYNDQLYDLLDQSDMRLQEPLSIVEDKKKGFSVKGLIEVTVSTFQQCLDLLKLGEQNRSYAQTKMNHHSSRSHTLYRLNIDIAKRDEHNCSAVLTFVDLAGSEKASIHESQTRSASPFSSGRVQEQNVLSDRVREGQYINRSLFFLTQVINLKAQHQDDQFIPYRNSPLTKILKASLGGNSRTAIVLCMTPSIFQIEQTQSTLRFGQNAKRIRNRVSQNIEMDVNENQLKNILSLYQLQLQDNAESSEKMQALIQNLESEKESLNLRLREYYINKIEMASRNVSLTNQNQSGLLEEIERNEIVMSGVGVLESSTPMLKYLDFSKQKHSSQCVYITDLSSNVTQSLNQMVLKAADDQKKSQFNCNDLQQDHMVQQLTEELGITKLEFEQFKLKANESKAALEQELEKLKTELHDRSLETNITISKLNLLEEELLQIKDQQTKDNHTIITFKDEISKLTIELNSANEVRKKQESDYKSQKEELQMTQTELYKVLTQQSQHQAVNLQKIEELKKQEQDAKEEFQLRIDRLMEESTLQNEKTKLLTIEITTQTKANQIAKEQLASAQQLLNELQTKNEDLKMDLHKHQLSKIKLTSKYEELKKRQQSLEQESLKVQAKLKEALVPEHRYTVMIDQNTSEQMLCKIETMMFKGIQRVNYERGHRASVAKMPLGSLENNLMEPQIMLSYNKATSDAK